MIFSSHPNPLSYERGKSYKIRMTCTCSLIFPPNVILVLDTGIWGKGIEDRGLISRMA
ncbi:MAG: hypothetical protein LBQ59_00730 [Candidatus Peribacteria bacterium]|nr:hypothetical protein [Candidatus Peribacteria bacterium]